MLKNITHREKRKQKWCCWNQLELKYRRRRRWSFPSFVYLLFLHHRDDDHHCRHRFSSLTFPLSSITFSLFSLATTNTHFYWVLIMERILWNEEKRLTLIPLLFPPLSSLKLFNLTYTITSKINERYYTMWLMLSLYKERNKNTEILILKEELVSKNPEQIFPPHFSIVRSSSCCCNPSLSRLRETTFFLSPNILPTNIISPCREG